METAKKFWQKPFTILVLLAFAVALGALALSMNPQPAEARVGDPLEVFIPCEEVFAKGVHAFDSDVTAACSAWMPSGVPNLVHYTSLSCEAVDRNGRYVFVGANADVCASQISLDGLAVKSPGHGFFCRHESFVTRAGRDVSYHSATDCDIPVKRINIVSNLMEITFDERGSASPLPRDSARNECFGRKDCVAGKNWTLPERNFFYQVYGSHYIETPDGEEAFTGENPAPSQSDSGFYRHEG